MSTRIGPTRVTTSKTCTIVLLNGVASGWASIPEEPYKIIGIEIYKTPQDVPKEYVRYTWGKEHCQLVAVLDLRLHRQDVQDSKSAAADLVGGGSQT